MARLLRCTVLAAAAASVAAKCADNAAWRGNSPDKGCDWVGLMSKKRCAYRASSAALARRSQRTRPARSPAARAKTCSAPLPSRRRRGT
ncbi:hypothetical protein M885DRAFT_250936 [Pelagophyceae sp. CCMP2097]|nr:hypothetical protein M885DRAFT_250936 [Pelagophyceae sp. CCMP2097]